MKKIKRILKIAFFSILFLFALTGSFQLGRTVREFTPEIVRSWQDKITQGRPGTIIIVTDRVSDLELGRKFNIPIAMGFDQLWFSNGGIYAYSYPSTYYDPGWVPPSVTSTFWYFDRNGRLLGGYRVDNTKELPVQIEVYFDLDRLPKNCEYSKGTYTVLIDSGRSYFLEIYDDGNGWRRGCDIN